MNKILTRYSYSHHSGTQGTFITDKRTRRQRSFATQDRTPQLPFGSHGNLGELSFPKQEAPLHHLFTTQRNTDELPLATPGDPG